MTKTIKSPVKEFPGTIVLPSFLTMPQALKYEQRIDEGRSMLTKNADGVLVVKPEYTPSETDAIVLDLICDVVLEWRLMYDGELLEDISPETFPGSPKGASTRLVGWVLGEIGKLYNPDVPES